MKQFIQSFGGGGGIALTDLEINISGDLQYDSVSGGRYKPLDLSIRDTFVYMQNNHPDGEFHLHLGDYMNLSVDTSTSQYASMNAYLLAFLKPHYAVLGNHDVGNTTGTNSIISDYFQYADLWEQVDNLHTLGYGFVHIRDQYYMLLINTNETSYGGLAAGTSGTGRGNISDAQTQYIQDSLDSIDIANARVLIAMHQANNIDIYPDVSYLMEETRGLQLMKIFSEWQKKSNYGLILPVFNGHCHLNGTYFYDGYFGELTNIQLNDSLPEQGWTGYTGTESVISTDPAYFQYSNVKWNEKTLKMTIDGIGQDSSYVVDLADRYSPPYVPVSTSEKPIIGTLSVTNPSFRLTYLTVNATHTIGVLGYEVYIKWTGGDLPDKPLQLWKTVYAKDMASMVMGQMTSGGNLEVYCIAFDELGNKSLKSNTVIINPTV